MLRALHTYGICGSLLGASRHGQADAIRRCNAVMVRRQARKRRCAARMCSHSLIVSCPDFISYRFEDMHVERSPGAQAVGDAHVCTHPLTPALSPVEPLAEPDGFKPTFQVVSQACTRSPGGAPGEGWTAAPPAWLRPPRAAAATSRRYGPCPRPPPPLRRRRRQPPVAAAGRRRLSRCRTARLTRSFAQQDTSHEVILAAHIVGFAVNNDMQMRDVIACRVTLLNYCELWSRQWMNRCSRTDDLGILRY